MNAVALSVLVALASALSTGAQTPNTPPPTTPMPNGLATWKANEYPVTVTGCIRGKNVVVADIDGEGSLFATRARLLTLKAESLTHPQKGCAGH